MEEVRPADPGALWSMVGSCEGALYIALSADRWGDLQDRATRLNNSDPRLADSEPIRLYARWLGNGSSIPFRHSPCDAVSAFSAACLDNHTPAVIGAVLEVRIPNHTLAQWRRQNMAWDTTPSPPYDQLTTRIRPPMRDISGLAYDAGWFLPLHTNGTYLVRFYTVNSLVRSGSADTDMTDADLAATDSAMLAQNPSSAPLDLMNL